MNRLGVVLLTTMGIWFLWSALMHGAAFFRSIQYLPFPAAISAGAPSFLAGVLLCVGVLRWRVRIANALFGEDDESVGSVSLADAQATVISLFGVVLLCSAVPDFVRHLVWMPHPRGGQLSISTAYPVGQFVADGLQAAIGGLLLVRSKEVAARFLAPGSVEDRTA